MVPTAGGLAALAFQMPGGLILDAVRSERRVAALAMIGISVSALVLALWPIFPAVLGAQILHAAASCVLNPAIAAISLGLVGHAAIGERFGRNARFASIGSGLAAAGMGATGYFLSNQAVFLVTALLAVPTLIALAHIPPNRSIPCAPTAGWHTGARPRRQRRCAPSHQPVAADLCRLRRHLSAGERGHAAADGERHHHALEHLGHHVGRGLHRGAATRGRGDFAAVGRWAQRWGRRPILLLGFGALPIRGLLFMVVTDPSLLVAIQLLDGICAAVFGVLVPLSIADITRDTGRFNLAQGIVGTGIGIGASLSTTLGGLMSDRLGSSVAFLGLACIGAAGFVLFWLLMPETGERRSDRKLLASGRK